MKQFLFCGVLSFSLFLSACSWATIYPLGKITLKVVDEASRPVEAAQVSMGFDYSDAKASEVQVFSGPTDSEGLFNASSRSLGDITFKVEKPGYYQSYGEYQFRDVKLGRLQPWNPEAQLVLRRKINPVKMYARNTRWSGMEIPVVGEPVGFDLMEYAWMPPYGGGKHPDFIFKLERRYAARDDYDLELSISFPNQFDGIQLFKEDLKHGSVFKLPRHAPESGYDRELVRFLKRKPYPKGPITDNFAVENNYFFRVRSEEEDGKLVRAMYGKIQGDILIKPRGQGTAEIRFIYFLNPDYTTNLEYGGNLFENLPIREAVGMREYTH